ncbi:MAG: ABC transporter substrate-binding protein, partial [Roseiarcus sp.]
MVSRRSILQLSAVAVAYAASGVRAAWAENAPGVTDAEIKFGQSIPYSGPASSYSTIGRAEIAYFKMINEKGGVHGRKLNFISLDDGYSAPKTVEQTRRLVEQERVAFIFQTLGGFTNLAIRAYLNENKVPQLFGAAGANQLDDPERFPWTVGFNPATDTEARIYAKHILVTRPDAKIGVIYQNDQLGRSFLTGLRDGLGPEHAGAIVKEVSYEVSDPTVDSQVVTLQGAGADTLIIAATPKAASQTIRKAYDIGWMPERYLFFGSASIVGTLKPAGLDKSKGLITAGYLKDATDPRW